MEFVMRIIVLSISLSFVAGCSLIEKDAENDDKISDRIDQENYTDSLVEYIGGSLDPVKVKLEFMPASVDAQQLQKIAEARSMPQQTQ